MNTATARREHDEIRDGALPDHARPRGRERGVSSAPSTTSSRAAPEGFRYATVSCPTASASSTSPRSRTAATRWRGRRRSSASGRIGRGCDEPPGGGRPTPWRSTALRREPGAAACADGTSSAASVATMAGGLLPRQRVRLARPEVEPVAVAALAGGRSQRRRQVVHLGVGRRRAGTVVGQKAVDDAARPPARERAASARSPRRPPARPGARVRARLVGAQERRAELRRGSARRRARRRPPRRGDPAGGTIGSGDAARTSAAGRAGRTARSRSRSRRSRRGDRRPRRPGRRARRRRRSPRCALRRGRHRHPHLDPRLPQAGDQTRAAGIRT